jgi:hypothetical protein
MKSDRDSYSRQKRSKDELEGIFRKREAGKLNTPVFGDTQYQADGTPVVFPEPQRNKRKAYRSYGEGEQRPNNLLPFMVLFPTVTIAIILAVYGAISKGLDANNAILAGFTVWGVLMLFMIVNMIGEPLYWLFSLLFWTLILIVLFVVAFSYFSERTIVILFV